MSDRAPNQTFINNFSVAKLNFSNYNSWSHHQQIILRQKSLYHHIEYESFDDYRAATYKFSSIKEKKYFTTKNNILAKPLQTNAALPDVYTQDNRDTELEALETDYAQDFKTFESDRRKAQEKWDSEEQILYGIFQGSIENDIWQDAQCLMNKSSYFAWEKLKELTGQQTTSCWVQTVGNFFNIKWKNNDTLTSFAARITKSINDITLLGIDKLNFTEQQIIAKIASEIPDLPRFQPIIQTIFRETAHGIKFDFVKKLFIEEDKRNENAPKQPQPQRQIENANQVIDNSKQPQGESKKKANTPRPCSTKGCKEKITNPNPNHKVCPSCYKKSKEVKESEKKKSTKIANVIVLNSRIVKPKPLPKVPAKVRLIYDTGSTSHITNGSAILEDLKPSSKKICGPTGEIASATQSGTIVFHVQDSLNNSTNQLEFKNALVVPSLQFNLISGPAVCNASPENHVIFNQKKLEIFQGEIIKIGRTIAQGEINDDGLYELSPVLDSSATREAAEAGRSIAAKVEVLEEKSNNRVSFNSKNKNFLNEIPISATGLEPSLPGKPGGEPGKPGGEPGKPGGEPPLTGILRKSLLTRNLEPSKKVRFLDETLDPQPALKTPSGLPNGPGVHSYGTTKCIPPISEDTSDSHSPPTSAYSFSLSDFSDIFSIFNDEPYGTRQPMPNFFERVYSLTKQPSRTLEEWHVALAHLSRSKLLRLAELDIIKIKNTKDTLDCITCDSAKMKRKKFEKSMPPKADNVGEAIYSDVCGKISPPTFFGEQYIVTFIDEFSGYISVYLIKNKNQVEKCFKEVRALFNNQNSTTSIKVLVSDGGRIYWRFFSRIFKVERY